MVVLSLGIALVVGLAAADPGTNPNPQQPVVVVQSINAECGSPSEIPVPKGLFGMGRGVQAKNFAQARAIENTGRAGCVTAQADASATVRLAGAVDDVCRGGKAGYVVVGGNTFACNGAAEYNMYYGATGGAGSWAFGSKEIADQWAKDEGITPPPTPTTPPAGNSPTAPTTPPVPGSRSDLDTLYGS